MDLTKPSRVARIALFSLLILVIGCVGLKFWVSKIPLFDPAPKGEGSFKEADSISKQFRDYYRTKDFNLLPQGYVRLEGLGEDGYDGTWVIYYATASHSRVRGGTILLLDSTGTLDTYYGHHCSSGNGGRVGISVPGFSTDYYEGGIEIVRAAFKKAFKHQKTEQAGPSGGDKPPI